MPSESGVTSSSSMSRLPLTMMLAWIAAPSATTSFRIEVGVGLAAEQLAHRPPDERDARRSADEHHLVDLRRVEAGVGERQPARLERPRDDGLDDPLELVARDRAAEERGTRTGLARLRHADLGLLPLGEVPLRLDHGLPDRLEHGGRRRPVSHLSEHQRHEQLVGCRRRRGACRRWWRAPGRRPPRRAGSRCRTSRRRSRTRQSCRCCARRGRRRATPPSAR